MKKIWLRIFYTCSLILLVTSYFYTKLPSAVKEVQYSEPDYFAMSDLKSDSDFLVDKPSLLGETNSEQVLIVSEEACINADLALKKREHFQRNVLKSFVKDTKTSISHERVAMLAGIPLDTYRKQMLPVASTIYKRNLLRSVSLRIAIETGILERASANSPINILAKKKIINAIDAKEYLFFKELLKNKPKQQLQLGDVDLLTAVLVRHPDLAYDELQMFIQAGLRPTLLSLTQLYHRENRIEMLQLLLSYGEYLPLNTIWTNGYYKDNLLTDALRNKDFVVADFWYQYNISPLVKVGEPNALDYYPIPTPEQINDSDRVLLKLLADVVRPYDPSNREKINRILHDFSRLDFETYQIPPLDIGPVTTKDIANLHSELGKVNNAVEGIPDRNSYEKCKEIPAFQEYLTSSLVEIDQDFTVEDVVNITDVIPDIASPFVELLSGSSYAFDNLKESLGIEIDSSVQHQVELLRALQEGRSADEIIHIADNLAVIPDLTINHVAINARDDLMDYFLNRGLNINYADEHGRGPLYYALTSPKPYRMFAYLAQHGAKPQAADPLMRRAIEFALRNEKHIKVLQWTARYAQIKQEHISYFYQIATEDQPNYDAILKILESEAN